MKLQNTTEYCALNMALRYNTKERVRSILTH